MHNATPLGTVDVARLLDEKGRCCGRKPSVYRHPQPHLFCWRCDRVFDPETEAQIENWAWRRVGQGARFERVAT